jgi:hypothetical protein
LQSQKTDPKCGLANKWDWLRRVSRLLLAV